MTAPPSSSTSCEQHPRSCVPSCVSRGAAAEGEPSMFWNVFPDMQAAPQHGPVPFPHCDLMGFHIRPETVSRTHPHPCVDPGRNPILTSLPHPSMTLCTSVPACWRPTLAWTSQPSWRNICRQSWRAATSWGATTRTLPVRGTRAARRKFGAHANADVQACESDAIFRAGAISLLG